MLHCSPTYCLLAHNPVVIKLYAFHGCYFIESSWQNVMITFSFDIYIWDSFHENCASLYKLNLLAFESL